MFIIKHKPSDKFYKRGCRKYYSKLVPKNEATIFRSKSGILNCVGDSIPNPKHKKFDKHQPFTHKVLNEKLWEIIPITIEEKL